MDLGKPIGSGTQHTTLPTGGFDQGEHGAGTGLSGGHGVANAANTQSGGAQSGFNAGLGGEHASGGLPSHGTSQHPIADKFMGSGSTAQGGSKLDNALDQYSGQGHHSSGAGLGAGAGAGAAGLSAAGLGHSSHGGAAPSGDAVSGQYAGSGARDALTGESHAQRTGAGVGPLGENTQGHQSGSHVHGSDTTGRGAALGGAGVAGAAGATALGAGATGHQSSTASQGLQGSGAQQGEQYGTGVGASGGAGGHYSSGLGTSDDANAAGRSANQSTSGSGLGSGAAGAGAAGAGAGAAAGGAGHFGRGQETDFDRGAPVSDPKHLETDGPHGLVFQESTGKYVHRRDLEK